MSRPGESAARGCCCFPPAAEGAAARRRRQSPGWGSDLGSAAQGTAPGPHLSRPQNEILRSSFRGTLAPERIEARPGAAHRRAGARDRELERLRRTWPKKSTRWRAEKLRGEVERDPSLG